jgi:gamma-glutamyltranspeptidase/glutathione hydrolase
VYARDGVPVAPSLAASLAWEPDRLVRDPGLAEVFFPGGAPLTERDELTQAALADTLSHLRDEGPKALYGGDVGESYARGLHARGSPLSARDLADHEVDLDSPLTAAYRDLHISVCPPNSQGFVLLEILLGLERLGLDPDPLGPDAGTLAELFRAASADRDRHNADPRRARVPVGTLLDEGHIAGLCDAVRNHVADGPTAPARGDTIALVAADAEGFAVSLIQSLSSGFGSGILEPSTGILAHNRGALFGLDPSSPNMLEGGKRPAHTLMPVVVHGQGQLAAVTGTMGGGAQPQINAQNLLRSFDLGLTPGEALDAPRWLVGGMEPDATLRHVEAEARVPISVAERLADAGYEVRHLGPYDEGGGHSHLIRVTPDGTMTVATDPRADGSALAG